MATPSPNQPTQTWVIKAGSSLLTNHGKGLDKAFIKNLAHQIAHLHKQGIRCVLVSSGAVAEGMTRVGWKTRPNTLHELQAAAAIGQMGLIQAYESNFQEYGIHTAQILLTHDDLSSRKRYLNARSTLRTLLNMGVVPIINENDTVATDEIKLGDNDSLAALVTNLIEAKGLVLLTDQDGMYETDPNKDPDAKKITTARANDPQLLTMAGQGSAGTLGRGGMLTKVTAANTAARSGATTIIASGKEQDVLAKIVIDHQAVGTKITPDKEPITARKQWLAGHLQVKGQLTLDEGAVKVLLKSGGSLLPVGVTAVSGDFQRGEAVVCVNTQQQKVAYGLSNYAAEEARKIIGHPSQAIETLLGYVDEQELIHRDNLVLI